MRYILFSIIFVISISLKAQEIKFSNLVGYAIGETYLFKKIMLSNKVNVGAEFKIKDQLYLTTSVGISTLRYNYNDNLNNQVFNKTQFVDLLISAKKYYSISKAALVFIEFGIIGSFLHKNQCEIKLDGLSRTITILNPGFNGVFFSTIAYKRAISTNSSIDIGISQDLDFFYSYRNKVNKISARKHLFCLTLYRKLKQ